MGTKARILGSAVLILFWWASLAFGAADFPDQPLLKRAQAGEPKAQNRVGEIYANGTEVERDYAEALKWFRRAAKKGNDEAWKNIGWSYAFGKGVPQNSSKALYWLRKSAEHGNAEAQFYLGLFYETGRGIEKNSQEAEKWYEKAASQGHLYATKALERLKIVGRAPIQTVEPGNEVEP